MCLPHAKLLPRRSKVHEKQYIVIKIEIGYKCYFSKNFKSKTVQRCKYQLIECTSKFKWFRYVSYWNSAICSYGIPAFNKCQTILHSAWNSSEMKCRKFYILKKQESGINRKYVFPFHECFSLFVTLFSITVYKYTVLTSYFIKRYVSTSRECIYWH